VFLIWKGKGKAKNGDTVGGGFFLNGIGWNFQNCVGGTDEDDLVDQKRTFWEGGKARQKKNLPHKMMGSFYNVYKRRGGGNLSAEKKAVIQELGGEREARKHCGEAELWCHRQLKGWQLKKFLIFRKDKKGTNGGEVLTEKDMKDLRS